MPCSPKMNQCKASCLHRRFVMGYREERLRQETDLIERNYGYATEIADEIRVRAENGTPLIDFRTWLKAHKRPEEDIVTTPEPVQMEYGNKLAEENLLAVAMREKSVVWMVNDLGPEAFLASPLNAHIAEGIIELERQRIRAHWGNVEVYLERKGVAPTHENGTKYGLRSWHENAGPAIFAQGAADEVRIHYTAYQAERVLTWGRDSLRAHILDGPTSQGIKQIHQEVLEQMQLLGVAPYPSAPLLGPEERFPKLQPRPQALAGSHHMTASSRART